MQREILCGTVSLSGAKFGFDWRRGGFEKKNLVKVVFFVFLCPMGATVGTN